MSAIESKGGDKNRKGIYGCTFGFMDSKRVNDQYWAANIPDVAFFDDWKKLLEAEKVTDKEIYITTKIETMVGGRLEKKPRTCIISKSNDNTLFYVKAGDGTTPRESMAVFVQAVNNDVALNKIIPALDEEYRFKNSERYRFSEEYIRKNTDATIATLESKLKMLLPNLSEAGLKKLQARVKQNEAQRNLDENPAPPQGFAT